MSKINSPASRKNKQLGAAVPEMALLISMLIVLAIPSIRPLRIGIQGAFCAYLVAQNGGDNIDPYFDRNNGSCYQDYFHAFEFWTSP